MSVVNTFWNIILVSCFDWHDMIVRYYPLLETFLFLIDISDVGHTHTQIDNETTAEAPLKADSQKHSSRGAVALVC